MLKFNVFHSSHVNPFMPNIISHPYHLDESIFNFRVVGIFHFYSNFKRNFCKQTGEPDQKPQNAMSDLVLHCLPMSHKNGR